MTPVAASSIDVASAASLAPDPMVPRFATVSRVIRETRDTFTVFLDVSAWPDGFAFEPGQFNMLYTFGVGEVPISISGDPSVIRTLVHTIRAVGTVTRRMWNAAVGDVWGVRGPFGTAWPTTEARGHDVLIMAGGIGLAPLRPMIYHLLRHREDYGRVIILYGTRTPEDVLYAKELERWRGRFDVVLHVSVDRGGPRWRGHVGVVTSLLPLVRFDPADTVAVLCGPEVMMRFGVRELQQRGVGSGNIFASMERNMKCGIGLCGHCQYGPTFVCRDGPVFRFDRIEALFNVREV